MTNIEILGYVASVFVSLSLLMGDIRKLRYVNMIGCALFVVYGLYLQAMPVVLMNGFGVAVNIYHIFKIHKNKA